MHVPASRFPAIKIILFGEYCTIEDSLGVTGHLSLLGVLISLQRCFGNTRRCIGDVLLCNGEKFYCEIDA